MNPTHHKSTEPGAARNAAPAVVVQHRLHTFTIVHRAPQLTGEPEHCVCADNDAIALFWDPDEAKAFCRWRKTHSRHEREKTSAATEQ
jgi:hypothetical protein